MTNATQQKVLRRAIEHLLDPINQWQASQRRIQCTPVFGAYGEPAYWIIVLDGSPPKASIFIQTGWNRYVSTQPHSGEPAPIYIASDGAVSKLSARSAEPLNALLEVLYDKLTVLTYPQAFTFEANGSIVEIDGRR